MYSVFEEVLHEADLKYIGILLNYGLSVEKIAKDFELDEAYVREIKAEIDSKREVNKMHTKWEEAQHDDRINFVSVMLERFSTEEITEKMDWDKNYVESLKSEIDSKKESN